MNFPQLRFCNIANSNASTRFGNALSSMLVEVGTNRCSSSPRYGNRLDFLLLLFSFSMRWKHLKRERESGGRQICKHIFRVQQLPSSGCKICNFGLERSTGKSTTSEFCIFVYRQVWQRKVVCKLKIFSTKCLVQYLIIIRTSND